MKVIIIEDEIPAQLRIKSLIKNNKKEFKIQAVTGIGEEAIKLIDENQPELIFLDIQLLDMTGFQVLSQINWNPMVIFTTAYHEYALKAFEHYSIDYLLKPISQERFDKSIDKLKGFKTNEDKTDMSSMLNFIEEQKAQKTKTFSIKLKDRIILTEFDEILYFQADDKYVDVFLENGKKYLINETLNELENKLPESFLRIHRSYIVNKDKVIELRKYFKGKYMLLLNDAQKSTIPSSNSYNKAVKKAFEL